MTLCFAAGSVFCLRTRPFCHRLFLFYMCLFSSFFCELTSALRRLVSMSIPHRRVCFRSPQKNWCFSCGFLFKPTSTVSKKDRTKWTNGPELLPMLGFQGVASNFFSALRMFPLYLPHLVVKMLGFNSKSKPPTKGILATKDLIHCSNILTFPCREAPKKTTTTAPELAVRAHLRPYVRLPGVLAAVFQSRTPTGDV